MVRRSLANMANMVNAKTSPAEVTTPPVLPSARINPVFSPASVSSLSRAINSRL
ncbi:Uncharacterised protein [Mycobacteroides abscessus subsp. abscessus]|nr:Uncharacterised protein [Mycobacteroides abscessus subsp. abscessus]SIK72525.1 Uncharacterised protein [Mycobacteroides abscessus subsp. abscessus]SKW73596.1 Uncharacterised protein [Mycobacteroides abscessus subsp. abscessus]